MININSMHLDELEPHHIEDLVATQVPEGEQIEFKQDLSRVTAFANAHGGTLVLGIKQSDTKPAIAAQITPIPRCAELAERLSMVFRDCVEPQIARLETIGIQLTGDQGVVVIRAGKSRLAPHRVTTSLVCPVRRADRSEAMTMREIQDMTLNVSRGMERLERRLARRSVALQAEMNRLSNPEDCFAIRFTACPVGEENLFDRLFERKKVIEELTPRWRDVKETKERKTETLESPPGFRAKNWRPILRGARSDAYMPTINELTTVGYHEIHCDGVLEIGFASCQKTPFSPDYPLVMFANLVEWARRSKSVSSVPMAEYAVDVEIRVVGESARTGYQFAHQRASRIDGFHGGTQMMEDWVPKLKNVRFPRYSLASEETADAMLSIFCQDFWNALEKHKDTEDVTFAVGP